jgi:hypothetical protein
MRFDKCAFFRDLGYEPHPGQRKVHESRAPRRVLACGVRWGKSRAAAMEALAAAMEPRERSMGWIAAPTYDLADKVFREVIIGAEHLRHHIVALKENEKSLILRNLAGGLSEIRGKSADNPVSLLGEGLDWLIIDEAARLKPAIWQGYLSQRVIDKPGWVLMISTPRGKGWFYDAFRRGQGLDSDYESWNAPSWENPHLDRALIDAERGRLPERVFRQEYGGEFLEGSGQVFRYIRESATGELRDPVPGERYVAGLDLAQVHDFTVLVIMNRKREVVFVDRFHRLDWSVQISRVKAKLERYGSPPVWVDSTGAGEPIFENLRREGIKAEGYVLTQSSKAALVDNVSILFEKREIVLPRPELWPDGIDELEAFEFSVTESGNVKTGAPGGMHDDCVIALGLAAWPLRPKADDGIKLVGVVVTPYGRRAREEEEFRDPRECPPDEPFFGGGFLHKRRWLR